MNLQHTPFSHYGSYMSIKDEGPRGLKLKSLRGKSRANSDVLKFIPLVNNCPVNYKVNAEFSKLTLSFEDGIIEICFDTDKRLLIRGHGKGLSLNIDTLPLYNFEYNVLLTNKDKKYCIINSYKNLTKFLVYTSTGSITLSQNLNYDTTGSASVGNNSSVISISTNQQDEFIAIIEDVPTHMKLPTDKSFNFESCYQASKQAFESFVNKQFPVEAKYQQQLQLAAYINWSSTVRPEGYLRRHATWASNNNFLGAWSWDHAFNALALAGVDDKLAYDQMAALFDYQDEHGQIPGSISDSTLRWNFAKPPVHGLFFAKMMKRMTYSEQQLHELYSWISKQVSFYLNYKDSNHDGICEYHHGNDSGQDNSTVFQDAVLIDSPDLTAFLIKAMDFLSEIATQLQLTEQSLHWHHEANQLTQRFIEHFIINNQPVARVSLTGEIIETNALLPYISLILADRLPQSIREEMIKTVTSERYLTAHGFATEAIDSPLYQDDAYWRGPIWAPSTLLLVEALEDCGEIEQAIKASRYFCNMINTQPIAENFNARTGEALRDKSFTWTASTFMYLASKIYEYNQTNNF